MDSITPYWYKVLNHFERKGYIYNGLTIPFLIGARTILEPQSPLLSVNELFQQIDLFRQPITIMRCNNIGEYVLGVLDNETNKMRNTYSNLYNEFGYLLSIDGSFKNALTQKEIATALQEEYDDLMENGLFSKNSGEWTTFTLIDKIG